MLTLNLVCLSFLYIIFDSIYNKDRTKMNEQMKKMFGLSSQHDVKMANNLWKMLDDMADSDPSQYKKFIQKNLKQGLEDAKQKKQQKQKPYKAKPIKGFLVTMTANLNEKPLDTAINQKVLITKQPWTQIKHKMAPSVTIYLNITYSDRIRDLVSRSTAKTITKYSIASLKDIQLFYYSLQGPSFEQSDKNKVYFCIILNAHFYNGILREPAGKKYLLGLCVSYLQERLSLDKNPLLSLYNPTQYQRLAFYNIEKFSIQIDQRSYFYLGQSDPQEFLLQKQIDKKRQTEVQKQKKEQEMRLSKQQKKQEIIFKQNQVQSAINLKLKTEQTPTKVQKKVLIQVLKEEQASTDDKISYQIKETQSGYTIQFLLKGISSIDEVNLQMKADSARIQTKNKQQLILSFSKKIDQNAIKAKFKKKTGCLIVEAPYE